MSPRYRSRPPDPSLCAMCWKPRDTERGYCRNCKAAYMRRWRKSHPLSPDQRKRDNARSYANVYKQRGLLVEEPCADCGSEEVQMHHPDYNRPLDIVWLCRPCHLERHRGE